MPVVVDLPLVPAIPILVSALLKAIASNSALSRIGMPRALARCTSGIETSTAAEVTSAEQSSVIPTHLEEKVKCLVFE
jgi:hypothetical protein